MKESKPTQGICVILCVLILGSVANAQDGGQGQYPIVDTGQERCYDNTREIDFPRRGQPFYGQDAQYQGLPMDYLDNGDGTITDLQTGLMWQKTPDFKMRSWEDAVTYAKRLELAGYDDWRLPTIKELFSIVDFRGNMHTRTPYINTRIFDFEFPVVSRGVRDMDAQYWSSNLYLGTTMRGDTSAFGFNFADGRIKSYPVSNTLIRAKKFARCVRGTVYGKNVFVDNGDGTITDRATGLTWMKADSGKTMNWSEALRYAENMEFAGHDDWRLPNVKELQSIVDYSRAPDARSASARGAAIDPIFDLTEEESWFWTSTTHLDNMGGYYVCFGQGSSAEMWRGKKMNAHGAGAVRSDPKAGDPRDWPNGLGPQNDEIRIYNYVRCVRGGNAEIRTAGPPVSTRPTVGKSVPATNPRGWRFVERLDTNNDGKVSQVEFDGPAHHFHKFDRNGDGFLSQDEAPQGPPPQGPPPRHERRPR
ncbi:MAG: DUF1566 domain-containing protein [Planctomycetes bacterium]|nr:DUF1566 domain-containing protein [Planctomycetota bacterium]